MDTTIKYRISPHHQVIGLTGVAGMNKIVLMGHSTGSQVVIHYLSKSPSSLPNAPTIDTLHLPRVDGGIMQAPVSDREYFLDPTSPDSAIWLNQVPIATEMLKSGRGTEILDTEFCRKAGCRMSAYRLWSLQSIEYNTFFWLPRLESKAKGTIADSVCRGDDDYFSSDIPLHPDGIRAHPLTQSFGKLSAPALALISEKDEYSKIPDLAATSRRWEEAANGRLATKIVKDANHAVEHDGAKRILCQEIAEWLHRLEP